MVQVTGYSIRQRKDGTNFIALQLIGGFQDGSELERKFLHNCQDLQYSFNLL